jgi:plasmid stabilization system protein ParE
MKIEWSAAALADLDRFADFLQDRHPRLSAIVGREIMAKAGMLTDSPRLGRAIAGRYEYRQAVLQVLNAAYVFRYRVLDDRIIMLRVFHGCERRG